MRVIEDGAGVVDICVHAETFLFKQRLYLSSTRMVRRIDCCYHDYLLCRMWQACGFTQQIDEGVDLRQGSGLFRIEQVR